MSERISLSLSPIGHWAAVALAAAAVAALTLWPYRRRIVASVDRRKWVVVGLRTVAVAMAILAMLRPSVLVLQKARQRVSVIFLVDGSTSMKVSDEADNRSRFETARRTLERGLESIDDGGGGDGEGGVDVKVYRFDGQLHPGAPEPDAEPDGQRTAFGEALMEVVRREAGAPIAALVAMTDAASNSGIAPLTAAQTLRAQGVPVAAVGFGSSAAGGASRDIAVTGVQAPEAVFVKNEMEVRGALRVRGFDGEELAVELRAEGLARAVDEVTIRVPEGSEVVTTPALSYVPEVSGERLLTLRVAPREGELIASNNEFSTFVSVLPGGLDVLHLQGSGTAWEGKFVTRALDRSREIQSQLQILIGTASEGRELVPDDEFAPGAHDVYILGDVPAAALTDVQHGLLARSVEQGAGLIMLGGRDSFGDGGWGATPLADVLPTTMRRGDGQVDPEGGLEVAPVPGALDNFVLQIGPTPAESAALWEQLPPIPGASVIGAPKPSAIVWALAPDGRPLMAAQDGRGRTIAFGGETWTWYRAGEQSQEAHRRFWRQAILWLAHQEDRADSRVDLELDRRRVPAGGSLQLTAVARDEQARPISSARYEATVDPPGSEAVPVDLFNQGDAARGSYEAPDEPGVYEVEVVATTPDGLEIGRASSRFLVFRDDQELENPAADIDLLQQIAELTGGAFLRPEQLDRYLEKLDPDAYSRVETQKEYRIWDNWPFLLTFVAVLGLEWWLRKRIGWV